MKHLLIIVLLSPLFAYADDVLPTSFEMMYTPQVKIVLEQDQCDASNVAMGWHSYALNEVTQERATGCWRHLDDHRVQIYLDAGDKKYLDFVLFKAKFSPVYGEQIK
jgi:hypothetical protein